MYQWPKYMDHYFSIDKHAVCEMKTKKEPLYAAGCIKRYLWIDIPDDIKLLKEHNVYRTEQEAYDAALVLYNAY